ncbi:MAG: hypothetical protein WC943_01090 [Elusimicrobiota bacterium]|jgi:hypothetical protein
MSDAPSSSRHPWKFFRAGGTDQVLLQSGADLAALPDLDPKLWVALSCPVKGLELDGRTLELLDTDNDGRVRVPEILEAVAWAKSLLKDPDALLRGGASLPLAAIDDRTAEGKGVLSSARQILRDLGKPEASAIGPEATADTARLFSQTRFNGDGIVPPASVDDPAVRKTLAEIILSVGGEPDCGGSTGVSKAKAELFFTECRDFSDWWKAAEEPPKGSPKVLILGEGTPLAWAAYEAVRAKADDFFTRCRLTAFDPRAAGPLNGPVDVFASMAGKDLSLSSPEIAALPLARVEVGAALPLAGGVNPAWQSAVDELRLRALEPLGIKGPGLSETDWLRVKSLFAPYAAWLDAKKGPKVEGLGLARVRALLSAKAEETVSRLIDQDLALKPEFEAIQAVDRLVRYHRDLRRVLDNFVTFSEFYGRRSPAVFQAGRLFIDGRSCDLCVRVADMGKHAALAPASHTFLMYCDCTRKDSPEKMTIAAALTGGEGDGIFVGRNGIFYDRQGRDWDATVVKVIEHDISVRQAVWSPYRRMARFIGEQIQKLAAAQDKAVTDKMAAGVEHAAASAASGAPPEKAPPFDVAKFAGILAAVGLAVGGLAAGVGKLVEAFAALLWWQKPLALLGLFVLISGPSVVITWFKLRQRNLGPLLDANGWAINGLVKINIPFGASLTALAQLPPGSARTLEDPFAPKACRAALYGWLFLGLVILLGLALALLGGPSGLAARLGLGG